GIKLRARAAANLLARVRHWQGLAIGAIADHGVHSVSDGENAGPERDLLPAQSTRIPGTVKELLVRQDDLGSVAEKRNAREHVIANLAVRAHDRLFVVIQRAGLA